MVVIKDPEIPDDGRGKVAWKKVAYPIDLFNRSRREVASGNFGVPGRFRVRAHVMNENQAVTRTSAAKPFGYSQHVLGALKCGEITESLYL